MNDLYKNRIMDMIDGTKRSDPAEAKRYLNDIKTQLEKISELVSIS